LALEREASLRRTNCGLEVRTWTGVEVASFVDRVEQTEGSDGVGEKKRFRLKGC